MRVFRRSADKRRGFTLVELLVAMSIFLVLSFITIGALRLGLTGEGVRTAARLVQSKLEGARDRAIYNSKETEGKPRPVGVRLLVDPNESTICRSMVYIESPGRDESSVAQNKFVQLKRNGTDQVSLVLTGTDWATLYDRGLIGPGTVVHVWDLSNITTYPLTIDPDEFLNPLTNEVRLLWKDTTPPLHPNAPAPASVGAVTLALEYYIELNPDVMADEEALELPQGVCIDLSNSNLPAGWGSGTGPFSNRMDIMFSAQGPCVGDAAAAGIIQLYLCDFEDALQNAQPGLSTIPGLDLDGDTVDDDRAGNELGMTIFTKAGRTIVHPIQLQSAGDPWQFGLEGEVAR
ncbi:MAG: type II secretion system protein [Planctomycetaceae bacterium]|nr:type II secretion system protein [Planctomycetaceae bacterium]